jgi:hypothetical protein
LGGFEVAVGVAFHFQEVNETQDKNSARKFVVDGIVVQKLLERHKKMAKSIE